VADEQRIASLLLTLQSAYAQSMYAAYTFTDSASLLTGQDASSVWLPGNVTQLTFAAFVNTTDPHMAPLAVNLATSALYAASLAIRGGPQCESPTASRITVRNYPLPYTIRQSQLLNNYLSGSTVTALMLALAFTPAAIAASIVKEREVGAKQQQLLSGVSIPAYWISAWIWDTASFVIPASLIVAFYVAFGIQDFVSSVGSRLSALITLLALYGASIGPFTYILTFLFMSHSTAQNIVMLINETNVIMMIIRYGAVLGRCYITFIFIAICSMIMNLQDAPGVCNADAGLRYIYRLFPGFGLGNGLYSLSFLTILPSLNANCARFEGKPFVSRRVTFV
jgi:hypothetical protein